MEEKRRVYYSFYDIPQRESFTPSYGVTSHQSITSRTEIMHLLIAIIVLSIAFSFPLGGGGIIEGLNVVKEAMDKYPIALFSIITGFFFHELSHKFIAQRYGLWAEFRMYPGGLLFAFLFGLLIGFVFAAPGAVTIQGGARRFEMGRIAAAGPIANLVIAAISLAGYLSLGVDSYLGEMLGFICFINIFLGFFNLLPFGPLDGKKVLTWNATVWAVVMTAAILILYIYSNRMIIPGWGLF